MKSVLIGAAIGFKCMLLLGSNALAGELRLISNVWDYICVVEVTHGLNAPNTRVSTYDGVSRNWEITEAERICYRRSGRPDDCESSLTNWSCANCQVSECQDFRLR